MFYNITLGNEIITFLSYTAVMIGYQTLIMLMRKGFGTLYGSRVVTFCKIKW